MGTARRPSSCRCCRSIDWRATSKEIDPPSDTSQGPAKGSDPLKGQIKIEILGQCILGSNLAPPDSMWK